jgi:glycosyltransferase involved in cell wall biosynthesis
LRVVIHEPKFRGHSLAHVARIAPAALEAGAQVTLALSQEALKSPEFATLIQPLAARVEVDAWMGPEPGAGRAAAMERAARVHQSAVRSRAEHVLIPHADLLIMGGFMSRLAGRGFAPRGVPVEALFFTAGLVDKGTSAAARLKRALNFQAAKHLPLYRAHHLDPRVIERLAGHPGAERAGYWRLMPDPVEAPDQFDRAIARKRLGLDQAGKFVGCVGVIDERKGCDLLINAFVAANLPSEWRLLLVGSHDEPIRRLLSTTHVQLVGAGRIVSIDRFVSTPELMDALVAMDLACTPYPSQNASASIIIRATAARRPVLGADFGWIEHMVPRFGLGWTCDVLDQAAFIRALRESCEKSASWQISEAAERFVRFHSPVNFQAAWVREIRARRGLAGLPERTWSWVLEALRQPG